MMVINGVGFLVVLLTLTMLIQPIVTTPLAHQIYRSNEEEQTYREGVGGTDEKHGEILRPGTTTAVGIQPL